MHIGLAALRLRVIQDLLGHRHINATSRYARVAEIWFSILMRMLLRRGNFAKTMTQFN